MLAREYGMKTLWEDGIAKVVAGTTTIEEVMDEAEKFE
jgi:type II secretory ATPase GspE/PulE/Tfp pilus assembly ATPase PilB-like protein